MRAALDFGEILLDTTLGCSFFLSGFLVRPFWRRWLETNSSGLGSGA